MVYRFFFWFALIGRRLIMCKLDTCAPACYTVVTMKIWRLNFQVKREPKPLSAETVTLVSHLVDDRFASIEANVKETRQRLETIYRKVYRDAEKEQASSPAGGNDGKSYDVPAQGISPGDTLPWH